MRLFVSILVLAALALAAGGCGAPNAYVGRVSAEGRARQGALLYTYKLDNGVTLLVRKSSVSGPTAVQVWVGGGSASDPPGKAGISHFTEHMLFTGSQHLPHTRVEQYIEGMGGTLTGHTGRDFSYIGATLPGNGWERAVDILYDLSTYPLFLTEELEKERRTVLLEMSQRGRDMDSLVMDNFFSESYRVHPYGRPVMGTAADVASYTREDVVRCFTAEFIASNMVVVVAGDVDPAAVRAVVARSFGSLLPVKPASVPVPKDKDRLLKRTKTVAAPVNMTYMALGWRVCKASDPDLYPLDVLRAVLGQGKGSRLPLELRDRSGMAFDVEAELFPLKDPGVFVVTAHLRGGDMRRVTTEVMRQINSLKDEPVKKDELERAINGIDASHMLETETAEGQAYALGYWATVYGKKDPAKYMDEIRKVTPDDITRVAQKYLGEGNYVLSVIEPEGRQ